VSRERILTRSIVEPAHVSAGIWALLQWDRARSLGTLLGMDRSPISEKRDRNEPPATARADPRSEKPDAAEAKPPADQASAQSADRVVFFDGVCVFCNGAMTWLADRDTEEKLHFASLQGETAAHWRSQLADDFPADIDTMAMLDLTGGEPRLLLRSRALLEIVSILPAPIRFIRHLRIIPRPLRDLLYRGFAALRYRLFGKYDACPLPAERVRRRVLP
jgi:predicted DCC family thiol-disulfide oxidoreductase YuxK